MSKLNFNFSISELCQRSDKLSISYKRDKAAFKKYGYDGKINDLIKSKTAALKQFPSDDHYGGLQKISTDNKNQIRTSLETNISDVRNRAKLALGAKSVEYSLFKFGKLGTLKDNELVQYTLHVIQTAEPRLEILNKRLITQETIDTLKDGRINLDEAIDLQSTAISERREKKVERNSLANELYHLLSEFCEVGKIIWKNKNEAFYTDYIIYGSTKAIEDQEHETEEVKDANA